MPSPRLILGPMLRTSPRTPRLSRHFQKAGDKPLEVGQRAGGSAPGKLGEWLQKPFGKSRKAVSKSGAAGRKGRTKTPV